MRKLGGNGIIRRRSELGTLRGFESYYSSCSLGTPVVLAFFHWGRFCVPENTCQHQKTFFTVTGVGRVTGQKPGCCNTKGKGRLSIITQNSPVSLMMRFSNSRVKKPSPAKDSGGNWLCWGLRVRYYKVRHLLRMQLIVSVSNSTYSTRSKALGTASSKHKT